MKKLMFVLLLSVACAPGQGAQSVTAPSVESGGSVTMAGKTPPIDSSCPIENAIPGYPVCSHVYTCEATGPLFSAPVPGQCCQVCGGGTFALRGDCGV